jgi:single-strand DNA-binding protein
MDLNIITLVGRAGRDPEIKYFDSGKVVCNFAIAVNRLKKDETDWFDLEIWGKTAEVAATYVKKGSLIGIIGSLNIESWDDKNSGARRSKPIIRVDKLDLLGSKKDNENQGGY